MKKVVILTRRNVGLYAVSYFVAKGFEVQIISDDKDVVWLGQSFGCNILDSLEEVKDCDILISVHWNHYIPKKYLDIGVALNVHPGLKYPGKNPIEKYIANGDEQGSIDVHYMTPVIDGGEVIHSEKFITGKCNNYQDFYNQSVPYYYRAFENVLQKLNIKP